MGGSAWPFLVENAIFGKCSDWLETPLKRCASTRAFDWCNRRVISWPTSKVMVKKLSPYRAIFLHISERFDCVLIRHKSNHLRLVCARCVLI